MTKAYPAYKDSGVEWLGEVPEGWQVVPVKAVATCNDEVLPEDTDPDWEIEYLEISGVDAVAGITETSAVTFDKAASRARRKVRDGDVLVSTVRTYLRAIAQVVAPPENMIASTGFAVLLPRGVASRFLGYLFRSEVLISKIIARSVGVSYPAINASEIMSLHLPLPPLPEQTAIAAFLDRETAKIDALVAEQRRLINLLREKRQAVISHAVTKGLNPTAPLKPSGIDWLGDVPEGWEVVPLRRILSMQSGDAITSEMIEPEGDFPVYGGNGLRGYTTSFTHTGDHILVGRQGALCGNVNFATGQFWASEHAVVVTPKHPVDLVWLGETLRAMNLNQYSTSAAQPGLSVDVISRLSLAVPDIDQQTAIGEYLSEEFAKIDTLTATAETAIALLQERRAALISAAVTGKIDVRAEQCVEAHQATPQDTCLAVAAAIISRLSPMLTFGRVKNQKVIYLSEAYAGITEFSGHYTREAAGPLDRTMLHDLETRLQQVGLITVDQPQGKGTAVAYRFKGDANACRATLKRHLGQRLDRFDRLLDAIADLDTRGTEAIATLFAAWNDMLIDGRNPTEDDVVREVLENWHPEKADKFTSTDLRTWLGWMKRKQIVPDGMGPKTSSGRLFT